MYLPWEAYSERLGFTGIDSLPPPMTYFSFVVPDIMFIVSSLHRMSKCPQGSGKRNILEVPSPHL